MSHSTSNPLSPGNEIPPQKFGPITREMLVQYAEASGDHNPIHLDEEVAKKEGLPGIIAHGMLSAGFLAERAQRFIFSEKSLGASTLVKFQVRFKAMVLLGDELTINGNVRGVNGDEVTLELFSRNQRSELTTSAVATFRV